MTPVDNRMKVVHCFRAPVGGLFRHVCDLVRGQYSQGFSIGIICDSSLDEHAQQRFAELSSLCSLGIKQIPMSRTLNYSDLTTIRQIADYCKEVQPQILHGHGAKGGAYARLAVLSAACPDMKTIYTPHGGSLHYGISSPVGLIYLGLERLLKKKTHGLIFESQYSADTYQQKLGKFPCDHKVIHNGLKEEEFYQWSDKNADYDFVFVGELRKLKGIDTLLSAIAEVQKSQPVKTLIVGAGPDEDYFKNKTKSLNIEDAARFSPPIFPASEAFKLGRCVVMPSLAESFPYIVLEALAAACPLISTNVGGIPEIYGPYKKDLIPAGDVSALADAMTKVLSMTKQSADQISVRSNQIQDYVKSQFGLQKMLNEVKLYYDETLDRDI